MSIKRTTQVLALAALATLSLAAKPALLKAAKDKGIEGVATCMSCHTNIQKDKVAFTAKGKYLQDRKKKEKAAEVDVTWLKDFKG
jgi:cytochrome c553